MSRTYTARQPHRLTARIAGGQDKAGREWKAGGEEGIRTLDTLLTYTPLAGERLRPLGHLSIAGISG